MLQFSFTVHLLQLPIPPQPVCCYVVAMLLPPYHLVNPCQLTHYLCSADDSHSTLSGQLVKWYVVGGFVSNTALRSHMLPSTPSGTSGEPMVVNLPTLPVLPPVTTCYVSQWFLLYSVRGQLSTSF